MNYTVEQIEPYLTLMAPGWHKAEAGQIGSCSALEFPERP